MPEYAFQRGHRRWTTTSSNDRPFMASPVAPVITTAQAGRPRPAAPRSLIIKTPVFNGTPYGITARVYAVPVGRRFALPPRSTTISTPPVNGTPHGITARIYVIKAGPRRAPLPIVIRPKFAQPSPPAPATYPPLYPIRIVKAPRLPRQPVRAISLMVRMNPINKPRPIPIIHRAKSPTTRVTRAILHKSRGLGIVSIAPFRPAIVRTPQRRLSPKATVIAARLNSVFPAPRGPVIGRIRPLPIKAKPSRFRTRLVSVPQPPTKRATLPQSVIGRTATRFTRPVTVSSTRAFAIIAALRPSSTILRVIPKLPPRVRAIVGKNRLASPSRHDPSFQPVIATAGRPIKKLPPPSIVTATPFPVAGLPPDIIAASIAWLRRFASVTSAFGDTSTTIKLASDYIGGQPAYPVALFSEPEEQQYRETPDEQGRIAIITEGSYLVEVTATSKLGCRQLADQIGTTLTDADLSWQGAGLMYLRQSKRRFPVEPVTGAPDSPSLFRRFVEFIYMFESYEIP